MQTTIPTINGFNLLELLGEGSFSQVYKASRQSDDQLYAMKIVRLNRLTEKEINNALNEVRILASINHQNIIAFKDSFHDHHSNKLCIIMELANGGDLLKRIQHTKNNQNMILEEQIWQWSIQMIRGLKILHDKGIVHRDFKPANIYLQNQQQQANSLKNNINSPISNHNHHQSNKVIFYSPHSQDHLTERSSSLDYDNTNLIPSGQQQLLNNVIKIGDLNISKIIKENESLASTQAGTPYYASPEIWSNNPYNFKSDIWSLGCVIYELCALQPPFMACDLAGLYGKIIKGKYHKIPSLYSEDLSKLISYCLQLNPDDRLDCNQLLRLPIILKRTRNLEDNSSFSPTQFQLQQQQANSQKQLIQTIKAPKDLKLLKERLPKSNYQYQNFVTIQQQQNVSCDKSQQQQLVQQQHCSPIRSISIGDHINNSYNAAAVAAAAAAVAISKKINRVTEISQNYEKPLDSKRRQNVLTEISNVNLSPRSNRKMGSVSPKKQLNLKLNQINLADIINVERGGVKDKTPCFQQMNQHNNNVTNLPSIINRASRNNSNNSKYGQKQVNQEVTKAYANNNGNINMISNQENVPQGYDQPIRLRSGRRLRQHNARKNIQISNIFMLRKRADQYNLDQISKNLDSEILQINKKLIKIR